MQSLALSRNEKLRSILNELKQSFQAEYSDRLVSVILFGSQARGEAVEESDIDVLIVLRGEVTASIEIFRTEAIVGDLSLRSSKLSLHGRNALSTSPKSFDQKY
jgi:uncharacterized protein